MFNAERTMAAAIIGLRCDDLIGFTVEEERLLDQMEKVGKNTVILVR
jgi:hypothetical protein